VQTDGQTGMKQNLGMRLKISERLLSCSQASYVHREENTYRRIEVILCIFGCILLERPPQNLS